MKLTQFDTSTGRIVGVINIPEACIELQLQDENVVIGEYSQDAYYIDTETKTPTQKALKPGRDYAYDYATHQWIRDVERAKVAAIMLRSTLLSESDWTQLPDVPLVTKQAWADYRQALRDITGQPGYPLEITWPTPPGAQS